MSNLRTLAGSQPFLPDFFPYRLAVLADGVSKAVASVYCGRFALTRAQWRVLAALADNPRNCISSGTGAAGTNAKDLTGQTMLDKVQVSRAVGGLVEAGFVYRRIDPHDKRSRTLALTGRGRALFDEIVPLVRAREAELLAVLDDRQKEVLRIAIDALADRAQQLQFKEQK